MQGISSFIIYPGLLVVGWISATLINYLCDTLPETRRFSQILCLRCHQPIGILDYILMKSCPSCSRSRKIRSWIVLFLALSSTFILEIFSPGRLGFWAGMVVVTYFYLVAVIDIEHRIIMHPVSIAGGVIGLCIGAWQHGWMGTLIGGIAGLGFMFIVYLVGRVFAKWLAKRKGNRNRRRGLRFW